MLSGLIDRLRPKNDTAEAIASALAETEAAHAAQAQRIAALEAGRGGALLEGGETARRHEAALREARDEAERLAALREALRGKHAEAETRERRAALERLAADAATRAEAAGRAIARDYPRLAAELVKLLEAERDALRLLHKLETELHAAAPADRDGLTTARHPRHFYAAGADPSGLNFALCQAITLPRHDAAALGHRDCAAWWRAATHV